ncbi:aspartate aminotransferase family protein [Streptomyces marincola]|uniref:aspartate aminotransferase family protein n=1 Tax=Streptomyces marincola TaxID=2878388 RepID=UPI001CF17053|nr:aminotransferase class III-fold pyridoxal phosphate-dependent enzyme [Streptomyces marincola]UCM90116.1 aminotransferase class III-fold pyridoxal phosphate-dependent enzyme [Streptomyces marincola]
MARPGAARDAASVTFDLIRRHQAPGLALTGSFAGRGAVEAAADGCRVTLSDGREMLDFGSYAVTLLGHRHPAVVAAVRDQLDRIPVSTRSLANPVTARAAAALAGHFGPGLPKVCFGLNGSDAVEIAVKLARVATGRSRVIAVTGGFHGKSLGALALTHSPLYRAGLRGARVDVVHVAPHDAGAVAREVAAGPVAALVFEPVQGENGAAALPVDVLRQWCEDAGRAGAFVIADEIQCGLRRCGERSVSLADGLPVDAVLVGKPLGGGVVPLSAVVCTEELYAPLVADPFLHSSTFGGHPLGCAALPAALAAIEERAEAGRALAAALDAELAALARRHPRVVAGVRGLGLLRGIDFADARAAGRVVVELARGGLLVSPCLGRSTTVRLLPPLVATGADIAQAGRILDAALAAAGSGPPDQETT